MQDRRGPTAIRCHMRFPRHHCPCSAVQITFTLRPTARWQWEQRTVGGPNCEACAQMPRSQGSADL
eukprot:11932213-Alexandrium_andersonii.AAC.1